MVSNNQFFVIGSASASSNHLNLYKITFSSTSVDWANQIACSVTWSASNSESLLSSDNSTIYSFFIFGPSSAYYLYFAGLSATDGSVTTTRYKSNTFESNMYGSALNGDYVVATTFLFSPPSSSASLVIYSISSLAFTVKSFSGSVLYGWGVEPSSGR